MNFLFPPVDGSRIQNRRAFLLAREFSSGSPSDCGTRTPRAHGRSRYEMLQAQQKKNLEAKILDGVLS